LGQITAAEESKHQRRWEKEKSANHESGRRGIEVPILLGGENARGGKNKRQKGKYFPQGKKKKPNAKSEEKKDRGARGVAQRKKIYKKGNNRVPETLRQKKVTKRKTISNPTAKARLRKKKKKIWPMRTDVIRKSREGGNSRIRRIRETEKTTPGRAEKRKKY